MYGRHYCRAATAAAFVVQIISFTTIQSFISLTGSSSTSSSYTMTRFFDFICLLRVLLLTGLGASESDVPSSEGGSNTSTLPGSFSHLVVILGVIDI